jgi:peptidoglycan hydrolase-like protein with peptidoglycan-binding domain
VRFAQRVLNATEGERLNDDGDPGPLTRGALERFREKYNLGAGSMLDDRTRLTLAQRALEALARQSVLEKGKRDVATDQALSNFKAQRGLGMEATLDVATCAALADALERRVGLPDTSPAESVINWAQIDPSQRMRYAIGWTCVGSVDCLRLRTVRGKENIATNKPDLPTGVSPRSYPAG